MRYILLIVCMLSLFALPTSFISAQEETNLGDILVRFCNDPDAASKWWTKTLYFEAETVQDHDICMYVSNTWPDPVTVELNFVDWTVTNDSEQKKACQPENVNSKFGRFVSIEEKTIELEANSTKEVYAQVNFPAWYAGMSYGCVTSQIVGQSETWEWMFRILSRRANFIDVLVKWQILLGLNLVNQSDFQFPSLSQLPELVVYEDPVTHTLKWRIDVTNPWNVAQDVMVTPVVQPWFSEQYDLPLTKKKVLPWQSASFEFDIDETIPFWKWSINTSVLIQHQPSFDFDSDDITPEMREMKEISLDSSFFLIPWNIIAALWWLLIVLRIVITRKQRKKKRLEKATATKKRKRTTKKKPTTKKKTPAKKRKTTSTSSKKSSSSAKVSTKSKSTTTKKKTATKKTASTKWTTTKKKTSTTTKPKTKTTPKAKTSTTKKTTKKASSTTTKKATTKKKTTNKRSSAKKPSSTTKKTTTKKKTTTAWTKKPRKTTKK